MSDDTQPSTLKSYVDSATGTIQSGIASVTGNSADQVSALEIQALVTTNDEDTRLESVGSRPEKLPSKPTYRLLFWMQLDC